MTYNILQGGQRGRPLYDVVRAVAPDVLMVNESPKAPLRWRRDCERLVDRCRMRYVAGGRPRPAAGGRPHVRGGVVSLSLVGERRVHEVRRVLDAAEGLQGPVVLAGDLNEDPGVPADLLAAAGDHRPVLAELELR